MVMIHGFGGTSTTFHPLIEPNKRFWSIRPDLPGAGRSPLLPENLTIASLTAAVMALLDRLQIACAHFVGHSMGTLVCQTIAAEHPAKVASLTLFSALTEPTDAARAGLIARAKIARTAGMAGIADQIMAGTLAPRTHAENPATAGFVRESIQR